MFIKPLNFLTFSTYLNFLPIWVDSKQSSICGNAYKTNEILTFSTYSNIITNLNGFKAKLDVLMHLVNRSRAQMHQMLIRFIENHYSAMCWNAYKLNEISTFSICLNIITNSGQFKAKFNALMHVVGRSRAQMHQMFEYYYEFDSIQSEVRRVDARRGSLEGSNAPNVWIS